MIFTVAIDGPAAAGKGTIGREVARMFDMAHLDTGLLYRATARRVLEGIDPVEAARGLAPDDLVRSDLRTADVGREASRVAALPDVRAALVMFQKGFARREGGAVLDGRDIGTVICPDAEAKLFVTASDACRARRRFVELTAAGGTQTEAEVLADLQERDRRDSERAIAPLRPARDAVVIDTTTLSIPEAVETAAEAVRRAMAGGPV